MDDQAVLKLTAYAVATEFFEPKQTEEHDATAADRFARTLVFANSKNMIDLLGDYDVAVRVAGKLLDVIDQTFGGIGSVELRPRIEDDCPAGGRFGHHELYMNAGPGGKRGPRKDKWQCCQACGANGPTESGSVRVMGGRQTGKAKALAEEVRKTKAQRTKALDDVRPLSYEHFKKD